MIEAAAVDFFLYLDAERTSSNSDVSNYRQFYKTLNNINTDGDHHVKDTRTTSLV